MRFVCTGSQDLLQRQVPVQFQKKYIPKRLQSEGEVQCILATGQRSDRTTTHLLFTLYHSHGQP
jgi:hypothetical protein